MAYYYLTETERALMISLLKGAADKVQFFALSRAPGALKSISEVVRNLEQATKLPADMAETLEDLEAREAHASAQEDSRDE